MFLDALASLGLGPVSQRLDSVFKTFFLQLRFFKSLPVTDLSEIMSWNRFDSMHLGMELDKLPFSFKRKKNSPTPKPFLCLHSFSV